MPKDHSGYLSHLECNELLEVGAVSLKFIVQQKKWSKALDDPWRMNGKVASLVNAYNGYTKDKMCDSARSVVGHSKSIVSYSRGFGPNKGSRRVRKKRIARTVKFFKNWIPIKCSDGEDTVKDFAVFASQIKKQFLSR